MYRLAKRLMKIAKELADQDLSSAIVNKRDVFMNEFSGLIGVFKEKLDDELAGLAEKWAGKPELKRAASSVASFKAMADEAFAEVSSLLNFQSVDSGNIYDVQGRAYKADRIAAQVIDGNKGKYSKVGFQIQYYTKFQDMREKARSAEVALNEFAEAVHAY